MLNEMEKEKNIPDWIEENHNKRKETIASMEDELEEQILTNQTLMAEIAYKMFLIVLHENYGFTPGKIKNVQRYVKDDLICINEGRCKLTEFFEMLEEECGQEIRALQDWKEKDGNVHGPDGMPK